MILKKYLFCLLTIVILISGCRSPFYDQTEANVADVKMRAKEAIAKSNKSGYISAPVVIKDDVYVDKTPISVAKNPSWLKNSIVIRGDQLPFSYYSRTIVSGSGRNVLTHYQVGLDPALLVSLNYSGPVKGALDLLAAKTGYVYSVNGNQVYWQAFITKTYDIAFMPGSSDYMLGKATGGNSVTSGTGGATATLLDDSAAGQYSSLKGSLSVWNDLRNTIQELLSPQGKVIVSESTTTVTVRDKPTNVDLVGRYINNLNDNLSKQVLIKVLVLDVSLNSAFNFGINWDGVKKMLGQQFRLISNDSQPIALMSLGSPVPNSGFAQYGTVRNPNDSTGLTALITALNQQGKTSIVTEPRVVCLNNQVSAIRIINQEGYLASVENTTVPGAAGTTGSSVSSQITPGTLITGLTLYVLPKIMGNKVYLQVNADLSNKISITSISSQTGGAPPPTGSAPGSVIQVPNVQQKQFNQRSIINSGDTLILSGFKAVTNATGALQLFNLQELGGQGAQQLSSETIVLITPIILHGYAS